MQKRLWDTFHFMQGDAKMTDCKNGKKMPLQFCSENPHLQIETLHRILTIYLAVSITVQNREPVWGNDYGTRLETRSQDYNLSTNSVGDMELVRISQF